MAQEVFGWETLLPGDAPYITGKKRNLMMVSNNAEEGEGAAGGGGSSTTATAQGITTDIQAANTTTALRFDRGSK